MVLDVRPMRWVGDISYSLYLWHWPMLVLPAAYLARDLSLIERGLALIAATGLAWLSYRLVESPIRRSGGLSHGRVRSLVLWPAAALVVVGAVALVAGPSQVPVQAATTSSGRSVAAVSSDPAINAIADAARRARAEEPLPESLSPSLEALRNDVSRLPQGCGVERDDPEVSTCVLGDPEGKQTLVLFGDSHVIMWRKPIENIAKARGWRIVALQKASCFPIDAMLWRWDKSRAYTECDTWRAKAYEEIARIQPDAIITSGLLGVTLVDPATGRPATNAAAGPLFGRGVRSSLHKLMQITPRVYVIGGTPLLPKVASDCLGSRRSTLGTCVRAPGTAILARNKLWSDAAEAVDAHFINVLPWLCHSSVCPVVVGNIIVYRDADHISTTFAATLEDALARRLSL